MKVALVSMPWARFDSPSMALATLTAYVKRAFPEVAVECVHGHVDMWTRLEDFYDTLSGLPRISETVFIPQLFPNMLRSVNRYIKSEVLASDAAELRCLEPQELCDDLHLQARKNVKYVLKQLEGSLDLVGFSVTYSQLFASLAAAKAWKERNQNGKVVFGGACVDHSCGPSLLKEFRFVDFVIQGEGEEPLSELIDAIANNHKKYSEIPGVIGQEHSQQAPQLELSNKDRLKNEIGNLDTLPIPDYDAYVKLAEEHNIFWSIPIEGSRGCWWNRRLTMNDPTKGCFFCNLNSGSYREKTSTRIASEIQSLTQSHNTLRLEFVDNVMRRQGLEELFAEISGHCVDYQIVAEVRSSITPYELLILREAGCHAVQIGIEGLSTSYLKRLGKGTTTIQNLQAMKTCFELGLRSSSNLLLGFPGATKEEVDETASNILRFAVGFQPTSISHFAFFENSTVDSTPAEFGIRKTRNATWLSGLLPNSMADRLFLFWRDFEMSAAGVSWQNVEDAVNLWVDLHKKTSGEGALLKKPLYYTDGGTFLEIVDRRDGFRLINLDQMWRDVFCFCLEVRSIRHISNKFFGAYGEQQVLEMLDALVAENLMFTERNNYLSLASAITQQAASERIRQNHKRELKREI